MIRKLHKGLGIPAESLIGFEKVKTLEPPTF